MNFFISPHCPAMLKPESHKQMRSQRLAEKQPAQAKEPDARAREARCTALGCDNPGLQDLLFRLALQSPAACDQALAQMEQHLATGRTPDE